MKKLKISKILGVGLTLLMVFSLMLGFMPATPAQAVEGNMQWLAQTLPTVTSSVLVSGSQVTDIAVGPDGTTIYAINNAVSANITAAVAATFAGNGYALYKSTNAGQSFTGIDLSGVVSGTTDVFGVMKCVAVAPDNPSAVAFAVTYGGAVALDTVYISTTGGISWAALPAFTGVAASVNAEVMDLAVGPARAGTIFGREYMAALADNTAAETAADVQIIGGNAAWASVGAAGGVCASVYDYMACQFSPSYVGDRSVALVGATTAAGVALQLVDARTGQNIRAAVVLNATVDGFLTAGGGNTILAADIAMPIDWDPSTAAGQRTYVCTASATIANDSVYRVDAGTRWDLGVGVTGLAWQSVAYSGVITAGKLFAGAYAVTAGTINTNVSYAADPQLLQPLWKPATTAPTGAGGLAVVRVAPDYAATLRVFVGTSSAAGAESAFSVSYNGGVSYQQESLIDTDTVANTVIAIDDIVLTPDASTIFMATRDTNGVHMSLWKSAAATVGSTSWSRIFCVAPAAPAAAQMGMLAVNPGYAATPALIYADITVGGRMRVSKDGGDTYSNRWAPSPAAALAAMAMESADVVYSAQGANVFKSINACWIWGAPYAIGLGAVVALDASAAKLVLVGATNGVAYSTSGGDTYTPIFAGLAGGPYVVTADSGYGGGGPATNLIYAAGTAALALTYRFDLGTGVGWTNLGAAPTAGTDAPIGVASNNGVLYSMDNSLTTVTDGCNRLLYPFIEPGLTAISWDAMNVWSANPAVAMVSFTAQNNDLFCATAATNMWAYKDYLATAKPVLTGPTDGTVISIDPVSGRANEVTLSWKVDNALNTGTGMAFAYQVEIASAGTGFAAPRNTWISPTGAVIIAGTTPLAGLDPTNPKITIGAAAGQWGINLVGGTAYEWHVRVRSQTSADIVRSGWSPVGSFTVEPSTGVISPPSAGVQLLGPTPGATNVSPDVGFSWAPMSGVTEYQFILATDAALTKTVAPTPALVTGTAYGPVKLAYGTDYWYAVKATKPTSSVQSIGSFTTMMAGVFTCPIDGLTFATQAELKAHNATAHAPVIPQTPAYIWAVIIIGAILVIVVISLIFTTRRVS
jgi:hypothetical protein